MTTESDIIPKKLFKSSRILKKETAHIRERWRQWSYVHLTLFIQNLMFIIPYKHNLYKINLITLLLLGNRRPKTFYVPCIGFKTWKNTFIQTFSPLTAIPSLRKSGGKGDTYQINYETESPLAICCNQPKHICVLLVFFFIKHILYEL